jgi:transposase
MLRRTVTTLQVLFERLQKMGYTGRISILKEYVHPLRPAVAGHAPVQRYETKPGEQVQFDWGEFVFEQEGKPHKFYGFTAILAVLCWLRVKQNYTGQ